jgi:GT2 family glycosyltransferase
MTAPTELAPTAPQLHDELLRQGVLPDGAQIEFVPHPPTFRRDPGEHRWHYSVRDGDRVLFHLIVGSGLRPLHEKAEAFARACPALACRPLFYRAQSAGRECLALEHFSGLSLDAAVQSGCCDGARWLALVRQAQALLQTSSQPSDFGRLEQELQVLVDAVCSRPALSRLDETLIRELVQPAILDGARREPPAVRWSNGDFAGRNLLLDPHTGAVRLIDYEHAAATHFGDDDWSRLFHFSRLPADLGTPPEQDGLRQSWREAYCWLRQLWLTRIVQPAPELDRHLAEAASRLLSAVAIGSGESGGTSAGSRLLALAAGHQKNTEALLASQHPERLLAAHAGYIEHLSRLLHRERKLAADRDKETLRELAALTAALAPSPPAFAPAASESEGWAAFRAAYENAQRAHRRELARLRQALALQRPDWTNLLKAGRHRLNLIAEWWLGASLPQLRSHRFRCAAWTLETPVGALWIRTSVEVEIAGHFRDFDGQPAAEIFARLGRRRIPGRFAAATGGGSHPFTIRFRTTPGFKFIRIFAHLQHGALVVLGYRLLFCEAPPAVPAGGISPSDTENRAETTRPSSEGQVTAPPPEAIPIPAGDAPAVSIVIPVYNQTGATLRCLDAIARHTGGVAYETIVIDDCSPEPEIAQLGRVRHLRLVRNETNRGFVRSCNNGARLARGRYIVLLNNDTVVQPGWLEALLETFVLRPDAGLVGAKLVYPDGPLQEAGGICWRDGSAWNYGKNQDASLPAYNFLRETDYCSAACIAVPTPLWRELMGFDERFAPAYYEDTDLAFRVRAAGRKVYYQPKAVVVHDEGRSNGTDPAIGIKAYQVRNRNLFLERWAETLARHEPNGSRVFRARERSLDRRIILVIDHHVPRPDRDAGSRNMITYLRFFLDAGYSVKFIGHDGLPHPPYTDRLERMGVEVLVGESFKNDGEDWLAAHGAEIDFVFLSRPYVAHAWLERLRRHTSARLLFYGHDLLSRSLRRAYEHLRDPGFLVDSCAYDDVEQQVFAQVDWIFYPSIEEVEFLRRRMPAAQVARLPLLVFDEPDRNRPAFAGRRGLLFVGGFGHPPNVDAMLSFAGSTWRRLQALGPDLHLTIAGSHPPEAIRALAGESIRVLPDVSDAELEALYDSHRVAIVPLRYGGGIKGKILEAMIHGLPVVTTPVGAEGLCWDGGHHLLVAEEPGFAEAAGALYTEPERWTAMQRDAWRFLAADYSPRALRDALTPALSLTIGQ